MLQVTPQHKILMAVDPVDFRAGIDGLRTLCQRQWQTDPFNGHVFVFRNRRATAVKLLTYDGNGFWLCHKRFSAGKLKWWPRSQQDATSIRAVELLVMLQQGNPLEAKVPEHWRRLTAPEQE
jgi:transposase